MEQYLIGAGRFGTVKLHPNISFLVIKECKDENECQKEINNINSMLNKIPHCIFPPIYVQPASSKQIVMYGCAMTLFSFMEKRMETLATLQHIINVVEHKLKILREYGFLHRDCHVGNVMLCYAGSDVAGRMPVVYLIDGTYLHDFTEVDHFANLLAELDCRRPDSETGKMDIDYDLALFSYSCHAYFRYHYARFPELPHFYISERALVRFEEYVNNRHQWSLAAPGGPNSLYLPSVHLQRKAPPSGMLF